LVGNDDYDSMDVAVLRIFDFALPTNAYIESLVLNVQAKCSNASGVYLWALVYCPGGFMGYAFNSTHAGSGGQFIGATSDTLYSQTWNDPAVYPYMPTPAQVNDDRFSVAFVAYDPNNNHLTLSLDYVSLVVTYWVAPTLTTTAVTSITDTGCATGGNITDQGDTAVTSRGVCWNTRGTPTIYDSKTTNGSGTGSFTSNPSGLLPSTKYYLRAYATNTNSTGYGAEVSFDTPAYFGGGIGRATLWSHALTPSEILTDSIASEVAGSRSLTSGTIVIEGTVKNRKGAIIPAHHVRAGWHVQNVEWQPDPSQPPPTLYITGHSVDLAGRKNGLTVGVDWMEEEIGVRKAELLAIPDKPEWNPALVTPEVVDTDVSDVAAVSEEKPLTEQQRKYLEYRDSHDYESTDENPYKYYTGEDGKQYYTFF
jgi:hypothetical protein